MTKQENIQRWRADMSGVEAWRAWQPPHDTSRTVSARVLGASLLTLVFAAIAFLVSGCIYAPLSSENADYATLQQLCHQWAIDRSTEYAPGAAESAIAELNRRNRFTETEMVQIANGHAEAGMREDAALCAWGYNPLRTATTHIGESVSRQYVFVTGEDNQYKYLSATDGVVTEAR